MRGRTAGAPARIDDPDVSPMLDNGPMGIVYPDVTTAIKARKAANTCKFASIGQALSVWKLLAFKLSRRAVG